MTGEEWAREIVAAIDRSVDLVPEDQWDQFLGVVHQRISTALRAARREGAKEMRKRCAVVADEHAATCPSDLCCRDDAQPCDSHAQVIFRAIRALPLDAPDKP